MLACEKNNFTCLSCKANDGEVVRRNCRDLWCGIPGQWDYAKCAKCGLVQQFPLPDDTASFYAEYPVHRKLSPVLDAVRRVVNRDVYYRPLDGKAEKTANLSGCDFGCGDGNFLHDIARITGGGACGFEFDPVNAKAVEEHRGALVFSAMKDLAHHAKTRGGFDFITMHNTFEHLNHPQETLCELAKMLKEDGEIYIAVPLFDCFEHKVFRQSWSGYDAPRHIFYPQLSHIKTMAESSGLCLHSHRKARFAPSLAGTMSIALSGKLRAPLFNLLMPMAWGLSFIISGSLLTARLKKPPVSVR
ncbi:MAG: class I SAM-dependent methyltransferase [Gammaproteobacteria bacterium]